MLCFGVSFQCGAVPQLQVKQCKIMNPSKDSLRFYYLGNRCEKKMEHVGDETSRMPGDTLIL